MPPRFYNNFLQVYSYVYNLPIGWPLASFLDVINKNTREAKQLALPFWAAAPTHGYGH